MPLESQPRTSDVVAMLQDQHRTMRRMIADVRRVPPSGRAEAFAPLARLVAVHELSEAQVVHPELDLEGAEVRAMVTDRRAEQAATLTALTRLRSMDATSVDFLLAFLTFADDVEEHAAGEEATVFPALEAVRGDDDLRRLSTALLAAQSRAIRRTQP